MAKKLYVGNLNYDTQESTVRTIFEEYGTVESVNLITDRDTGRPKGFGFVEMGSDEEAQSAIAGVNGRSVDGRELNVAEARPRRDRSFGGGGGYGGGGYGGGGYGGRNRW
jgi:RNA recognition motif-containing protein